jgi:hypothetical protein
MKMPIELKDKWVKALRSGKYKQGRGILYNPEEKSFCCLGVLEHICLDGNVELCTSCAGQVLHPTNFRAVPSREFYDEYGIDINEIMGRLVQMNDGHGAKPKPSSFKTIANYIVKNIKGY